MNQSTKQSISGVNPNTGHYGTLYQVNTKKPGKLGYLWAVIKGTFLLLWKVARTADVIIQDDSFIKYLVVAVLSIILFKYIVGAVSIILITALALVTLIRLLFNEEGKQA